MKFVWIMVPGKSIWLLALNLQTSDSCAPTPCWMVSEAAMALASLVWFSGERWQQRKGWMPPVKSLMSWWQKSVLVIRVVRSGVMQGACSERPSWCAMALTCSCRTILTFLFVVLVTTLHTGGSSASLETWHTRSSNFLCSCPGESVHSRGSLFGRHQLQHLCHQSCDGSG